ncbi:MAG: 50S ribosomal protein L17 [Peptococcaceae bacterium]|jgi:large subunit ribosomal protein L17|nr:50S ribosomal protein L17 [Peptococcaceae bacterium]
MARRKLGRNIGQRRALLRHLTTALIHRGRIVTTEQKAKQLRSTAEKMITLGKRGDLAARRHAMAYIMDETVVKNLFEQVADKYKDRAGGYTRIIKIGPRRGDAAMMCYIELV